MIQNIFAVVVGNVPGLITMLTLKCVLENRPTTRSIFSADLIKLNLRIMRSLLDLYENLTEDDTTEG